MQHKIISVVGARPQFVKAAAVSRAFLDAPSCRELLLHTGQHHDANMSAVFFEELGIPEPAFHLGIHGGSHGDMTGRMLSAIERIYLDEKPDMVVVYGDTNSTLAGALAAAKLHIPVAHIEAGLRSFNRRMPEEINRVLTDHVGELLFCPTAAAIENLAREGLADKASMVGDVMYDAALLVRDVAERTSTVVDRLALAGRPYVVATIHRAENTDDPALLAALMDYVRGQAAGRAIVFPVHPRTAKVLESSRVPTGGFTLVEPLGFVDMARLLAGSELVLTDSGGVQKEAYFHGVRCVTLRSETEWVETVDHGWNRLWQVPAYREPRRPIADYGDGHAAAKIAAAIGSFLGGRR
ncbi:MAG: UDP-N-acetylglucosamine 2-epimerase (non-hydrolyzing) [Rhizobiaceae bacterium]|nr:UDP-N-acetylglucosamine 2-epimerase (non-hydrolyzing) [Rhizobiaceae bacterium]